MDKAYSVRTPVIVYALEKDTDPLRPKEEGKDVLRQEYPYLSTERRRERCIETRISISKCHWCANVSYK
jgi:hypothetical protein